MALFHISMLAMAVVFAVVTVSALTTAPPASSVTNVNWSRYWLALPGSTVEFPGSVPFPKVVVVAEAFTVIGELVVSAAEQAVAEEALSHAKANQFCAPEPVEVQLQLFDESLATAELETQYVPTSQVGAAPPEPGVTALVVQTASHQLLVSLSVAVAVKVTLLP
jgi:hypothetical protein